MYTYGLKENCPSATEKTSLTVNQVTGTKELCLGIGIVIITLIGFDIIINLFPIYHIPNNPQHTLGTPALLYYNQFQQVIINTLNSVTFTTKARHKHVVYTDKDIIHDKLLDYIHIKVITLHHHFVMLLYRFPLHTKSE